MQTDKYAGLVDMLKTQLPDFVQSAEYRLHRGEMDDLPGVILAALGRYLVRMANEGDAGTGSLAVLNEIAEWNDNSVDEQIRDEFFEAIADDSHAERLLSSMMTERLRSLYDQWKAG